MAKKILIIDDEPIILDCLKFELEQTGYEVETAANGVEGLDLIRENYYNLLVTDLMMEGMSGLEVLRVAKEIDPELVVIILTGYGEVASAIEALRLGASDYLLKPCESGELLIRIAKSLEQQELTRKIKIYEKILPLCDTCRKVRFEGADNSNGEWLELDQFISRKTGLGISHGYCPDCYKQAMEEIEELKHKLMG
ncbi:MAG: response regulator [Desulfobulbaceae bacterium]|nr:response regulator [Desulfobulbaceae bacterium]